MTDKFIQKMDLKKGAFTKQAKQHGMTAQEFASHVLSNKSKFSSTTVRRAVLARTFKKMSKRRSLSKK